MVITEGNYIYTGNISENEACSLAKERAKLKALEKVIGQKISSEEMENCSEVDGKTSCERNQFFLATFNAEFTDIKILDKSKTTEPLSDGNISYICEIKISVDVEPIKQINDPDFNFNVELNSHNFKSGDKLTMEIGFTKPMYLTIFQFLPYEKDGNQVSKLFPNQREKNNFIKDGKITLPYNAKYEIYFPENVNKKNIDEYLFFLGSDEKINWLDEYNNINELKSS